MTKNFKDVFEEIKSNVAVSGKGNPVKSFSRTDFDKLAKAFLNTPDYSMESVSLKSGELVKKTHEPVKALRSMIQKILVDFGVDKQESERILTDAYEIRSVEGVYELCSELVYQYANAGKKFDFITREDFVGSILLKDMGESTSTHKNIQTKEEFKVHKKAHKVLDKKSKAPEWLKSRVK